MNGRLSERDLSVWHGLERDGVAIEPVLTTVPSRVELRADSPRQRGTRGLATWLPVRVERRNRRQTVPHTRSTQQACPHMNSGMRTLVTGLSRQTAICVAVTGSITPRSVMMARMRLGRRHIESGVIDGYTGRGCLPAESVRDLFGRPLLDRDCIAAGDRQIKGGRGCRDVERDGVGAPGRPGRTSRSCSPCHRWPRCGRLP